MRAVSRLPRRVPEQELAALLASSIEPAMRPILSPLVEGITGLRGEARAIGGRQDSMDRAM
eukprot:3218453-Alexandrium_andersonii.AAC.1